MEPTSEAWSLAEADIEPLFSQFLPSLARVYLKYADYFDNTQEGSASLVIRPARVSHSSPPHTSVLRFSSCCPTEVGSMLVTTHPLVCVQPVCVQ